MKRYQVWHFRLTDNLSPFYKPYAPRTEQAIAFCVRGNEVVEYVGENRNCQRPRSYIMGQYTQRTNRHISSNDFLIILVNFYPGVLYKLTGVPYWELTNKDIDAEAVFGNEIRRVNERMNSVDDYSIMITIIERFLTEKFKYIECTRHPLDVVANLILENPQNSTLLELAKNSFLSTRQFERKFKEHMGIRPMLFMRIARANKAFRIKYLNPKQDWLSIALECGYHDYQHLAKDFFEFASATPPDYFLEDILRAPERLFGLPDSSIL